MRRDLGQLADKSFDLLVAGGGIYGLIIACDAAQRGLSVALLERADFGGGSSFNHLRTIHGGLRYLQTLDLARARESIRERRTFARIAAGFVAPLPFVLPLPRTLTRGPWAMRAGFLLDALVARDRNDGVPASHRLPAGRVVGRSEAIALAPLLDGVAFDAVGVWYDYVTIAAERLTMAWAAAAAAAGATLANHVEATRLTASTDDARVQAQDRRSGATLEIRARLIVNATGGAVDRLLAPSGASTRMPTLKAMNVVTRRPAPKTAVGGRTHAGRNLFLVPSRGQALVGTWESGDPRGPDDAGVRTADLERFLLEIHEAFPSLGLTPHDVTLVHRGIVPAVARTDGTVSLDGGERIYEHTSAGLERVISVAGTKYTTARAVAEHVVDRALAKLGRPAGVCRTATTPLPIRVETGDALLAATAADEMVETLEDAVVRRTGQAALGYPGDAEAAHAAQVVGQVLGWDGERQRKEVEALRAFYL